MNTRTAESRKRAREYVTTSLVWRALESHRYRKNRVKKIVTVADIRAASKILRERNGL